MRTPAVMLFVCLSLPALAVGAEPQVQSRQLSADRFELTAQLPAALRPGEAQALLQPYADALCQGAGASFGRYRFEAHAPVGADAASGSQTFVQELACGRQATMPHAGTPAPLAKPTADDERGVRERTLAYLAAKDGNDFDRAYAMMAEESREMMRADNWRGSRTAFNAAAGSPTKREVVRLTWYDDPAGAPWPGRYVAADFRGDYEHAGFYCGYVMWYRQADGSYRVLREEEAQVAAADAAKIPAADLPEIRKQLGCRD